MICFPALAPIFIKNIDSDSRHLRNIKNGFLGGREMSSECTKGKSKSKKYKLGGLGVPEAQRRVFFLINGWSHLNLWPQISD